MEKKLYKGTDRKICGVCSGLANYFNIDVTIVRLIVAELAFFTALIPAFIVYLIVALVIPNAPEGYVSVENGKNKMYKGHEKKIAGVCSGIAEYFNIDSTLVRLVLLLLFLIVGNGLYTYIVLAWILPTAPDMQYGQFDQGYYNSQNQNYNPNQTFNPYEQDGNSQNNFNQQ